MDQFFTWSMLATFAGCTAATALLTQALKNLFKKLPTQWLSFFIAIVILLGATFFTSGLTLPGILLMPINAALISFSSNGAFMAIKRIAEGKVDTPSAD